MKKVLSLLNKKLDNYDNKQCRVKYKIKKGEGDS